MELGRMVRCADTVVDAVDGNATAARVDDAAHNKNAARGRPP
jgi:hypothetical protein